MTPKVENGKPNSVLYALSRGYVVASRLPVVVQIKHPMATLSVKAPAVIVDLQAAAAITYTPTIPYAR